VKIHVIYVQKLSTVYALIIYLNHFINVHVIYALTKFVRDVTIPPPRHNAKEFGVDLKYAKIVNFVKIVMINMFVKYHYVIN
jgi:hypothetical protein